MGKRQKEPAYVLGVGMTKFIKPRGKVDYTELGFEVRALFQHYSFWQLFSLYVAARETNCSSSVSINCASYYRYVHTLQRHELKDL